MRATANTATAVTAIGSDQVNVPCNGCTLCCVRQNIYLIDGDNPADYLCDVEVINGITITTLRHKPDGSCIYLDANGCSIHGRAPKICREFDCREMFRMHNRAERRRRIAAGLADAAVYEAGRKRLAR